MKQLLVVLGLGLAAGCVHRDAAHANRDADHTNQDSDRAFKSRLEVERAKLGAGRFEPPVTVLDPLPRGEPPEPPPPTPERQRVMDASGLRFVVEAGRVGYVPELGDRCGGWSPPTVPLFTRTERGVRIVLVKAKVKSEHIHVSGSCGMPGCGTQPEPRPEMVGWLDVPNMAAIAVETVEVPYTRVDVTCDHPLYPP